MEEKEDSIKDDEKLESEKTNEGDDDTIGTYSS